MTSLRTRLVVVLGAVLAASIAAAGLLSRRATLVEVRQLAPAKAAGDASFEPVADLLQRRLVEGGETALRDGIRAAALAAGRPIVWVDLETSRILAASLPPLSGARVTVDAADGALEIQTADGGSVGTIVVAGGPRRELRDAQGRPAGVLFGLPAGHREEIDLRVRVPVWMLTTGAIGVIGLVLMFALSRRILRPVSALTVAARRMEAGDLDVRVDQYARGTDEIANLAHAFNAMAARLSETERLRKQMVSDVAHELRAPVTNLRCTLEAMQDGLLAPDRANVELLHEETLFLQRLISDLQDLSLADAGQLPLRSERVDVSVVLRRVIAALGQHTNDAAVDSDVPSGLDVTGDPDRLEQVFRNIVANARRHTPAGGRIDIRAHRDGPSIVVEVTDTGAGIDAAHLPHVFDRFYRADPSRARATGGAGLGLAIVRQLIDAHGGTVTASSKGLGHGATFTVSLPAR